MPGRKPDIIKIYRIVHIDNVEHLLKNGMYHRGHANADPNYINIGDSDLIAQRHDYPVGINPPGGALGEYVPFYFGPLSPMLLNIKTGYRALYRDLSEILFTLFVKFRMSSNIAKTGVLLMVTQKTGLQHSIIVRTTLEKSIGIL